MVSAAFAFPAAALGGGSAHAIVVRTATAKVAPTTLLMLASSRWGPSVHPRSFSCPLAGRVLAVESGPQATRRDRRRSNREAIPRLPHPRRREHLRVPVQ